MENPNLFLEIHLTNAVECDLFANILQPGCKVRVSNEIMCQAGGIHRNAFVYILNTQTVEPVIAKAEDLLEVLHPLAEAPEFFVLCTLYSRINTRVWSPMPEHSCLPVSAILRRESV